MGFSSNIWWARLIILPHIKSRIKQFHKASKEEYENPTQTKSGTKKQNKTKIDTTALLTQTPS